MDLFSSVTSKLFGTEQEEQKDAGKSTSQSRAVRIGPENGDDEVRAPSSTTNNNMTRMQQMDANLATSSRLFFGARKSASGFTDGGLTKLKVDSMSKSQLENNLRLLGIPTTGSISDLRERLNQAIHGGIIEGVVGKEISDGSETLAERVERLKQSLKKKPTSLSAEFILRQREKLERMLLETGEYVPAEEAEGNSDDESFVSQEEHAEVLDISSSRKRPAANGYLKKTETKRVNFGTGVSDTPGLDRSAVLTPGHKRFSVEAPGSSKRHRSIFDDLIGAESPAKRARHNDDQVLAKKIFHTLGKLSTPLEEVRARRAPTWANPAMMQASLRENKFRFNVPIDPEDELSVPKTSMYQKTILSKSAKDQPRSITPQRVRFESPHAAPIPARPAKTAAEMQSTAGSTPWSKQKDVYVDSTEETGNVDMLDADEKEEERNEEENVEEGKMEVDSEKEKKAESVEHKFFFTPPSAPDGQQEIFAIREELGDPSQEEMKAYTFEKNDSRQDEEEEEEEEDIVEEVATVTNEVQEGFIPVIQSDVFAKFALKPWQWKCPTCSVKNDKKENPTQCVSCENPRPSDTFDENDEMSTSTEKPKKKVQFARTEKEEKDEMESKPTFTLNASLASSTPTNDANSKRGIQRQATPFNFGIPKDDAPAASPAPALNFDEPVKDSSFKFGLDSSAEKEGDQSSATAPALFNFGKKSETKTASKLATTSSSDPGSSFDFGNASTAQSTTRTTSSSPFAPSAFPVSSSSAWSLAGADESKLASAQGFVFGESGSGDSRADEEKGGKKRLRTEGGGPSQMLSFESAASGDSKTTSDSMSTSSSLSSTSSAIGFKFGAQGRSEEKVSSTSSLSAGPFGTASSSSGFNFGASRSDPHLGSEGFNKQSSAPSFSSKETSSSSVNPFQSSSAASSTGNTFTVQPSSAESKLQSGGFNFGARSNAGEKKPKTEGFSFSASNNSDESTKPTAETQGFNFSSSAPSSTFNFGAPSNQQEQQPQKRATAGGFDFGSVGISQNASTGAAGSFNFSGPSGNDRSESNSLGSNATPFTNSGPGNNNVVQSNMMGGDSSTGSGLFGTGTTSSSNANPFLSGSATNQQQQQSNTHFGSSTFSSQGSSQEGFNFGSGSKPSQPNPFAHSSGPNAGVQQQAGGFAGFGSGPTSSNASNPGSFGGNSGTGSNSGMFGSTAGASSNAFGVARTSQNAGGFGGFSGAGASNAPTNPFGASNVNPFQAQSSQPSSVGGGGGFSAGTFGLPQGGGGGGAGRRAITAVRRRRRR